eukprot:887217-Rhodomonas_salina.1
MAVTKVQELEVGSAAGVRGLGGAGGGKVAGQIERQRWRGRRVWDRGPGPSSWVAFAWEVKRVTLVDSRLSYNFNLESGPPGPELTPLTPSLLAPSGRLRVRQLSTAVTV